MAIQTSDFRGRLSQGISEFLKTLRVGIDIGERTGGIAVVRGNEILYAETYADYHLTTLEDRRKLRRGRRTRHAKKMRLARLRSWILRQEISGTIPGARQNKKSGFTLPDPYKVKHIPALNFIDARKVIIEKCKKGEASAEEFVKALTLIFQKRGFQWNKSDLSEMNDKALEEELKKVRLTESLKMELENEIQRREENPEPGFGGKIKNFEQLLSDALTRERKPRIQEHRSVVESELKEVVEGFTKNHCPENTELWVKQLIQLLNKVVRLVRFDNRVISGCSWCGKNTPRKIKVREDAYFAAVHNLRVVPERRRPLTDDERKYFLDAWHKNPSPSVETFKKKLRQIHAQEEMAGQLADLLGKRIPKGRTDVCKQHLKMAREGGFLCNRHKVICKILPSEEHVKMDDVKEENIAKCAMRNPCRENHDKRLVQRLENILFDRDGRRKYNGVPELITIEFPKPNVAQSLRCPACNEVLAVDLRVRYKIAKGTKGIKIEEQKSSNGDSPFKCPYCEKPLQIKLGREIRIGENKKIIYRQPYETELFLRKTAGGLKEKKKKMFLSETKGNCIYHEGTFPLDIQTIKIDHIFPQSRGGPDINDNLVAACEPCNTAKGDLTPWEWLGVNGRWNDFKPRVHSLQMPVLKKELLLKEFSKEDEFPENPTALARAGARVTQFIELIKDMLEEHGVDKSFIATNYEHGKIVIQSIEGWMTSRLRNSWSEKAGGNFPVKNDKDLRNHAQDAAVIAACPPHTWREKIFIYSHYHDRAPLELAPDWEGYYASNKAIVQPLGRYRNTWRTCNAKENPLRKTKPSTHYTIRTPIELITIGDIENIYSDFWKTHTVELIKKNGLESLLQKKEDKKEEEKRKKTFLFKVLRVELLENELKQIKRSGKKRGGPHLPRTIQIIRKDASDKNVAPVKPKDGPERFVVVHPANDRIEAWNDKGFLWLRVVKNTTLFKKEANEKAPAEAVFVKAFRLHDIIILKEKGKWEQGSYLVSKIQSNKSFTAFPEGLPADGKKEHRSISDSEIAELLSLKHKTTRKK